MRLICPIGTALRAFDMYFGTCIRPRAQKCWGRKMVNITGVMSNPMHENATAGLQDSWMEATKKEAIVAFDHFVEINGVKYEFVVKKFNKDRDGVLTFYDFQTEHWKHIRTTNLIQRVLATVRDRTCQIKGCFIRKTVPSIAITLMM